MFTEPLDTDAERSTIRRAAIRVLLLIQHQLPAWRHLIATARTSGAQPSNYFPMDCYDMITQLEQLALQHPDTVLTVLPNAITGQMNVMLHRVQQILHQMDNSTLYAALAPKTPLLSKYDRQVYAYAWPSTVTPNIDPVAVHKLLPKLMELYAAQRSFDKLAASVVKSAKSAAKQAKQRVASAVMSDVDDTFQPPPIPDNVLKCVRHGSATNQSFVTTSIASKKASAIIGVYPKSKKANQSLATIGPPIIAVLKLIGCTDLPVYFVGLKGTSSPWAVSTLINKSGNIVYDLAENVIYVRNVAKLKLGAKTPGWVYTKLTRIADKIDPATAATVQSPSTELIVKLLKSHI